MVAAADAAAAVAVALSLLRFRFQFFVPFSVYRSYFLLPFFVATHTHTQRDTETTAHKSSNAHCCNKERAASLPTALAAAVAAAGVGVVIF